MAYFNHIDDEFDFGKYTGLSLSDVMDINPEYVMWCMHVINKNSCCFNITNTAMKELVKIYSDFIVTKDFEEIRRERLQHFERQKFECKYDIMPY